MSHQSFIHNMTRFGPRPGRTYPKILEIGRPQTSSIDVSYKSLQNRP